MRSSQAAQFELDSAALASVSGGMNVSGFRPSTNMDRVNDAHLWTPTEDGRVVGPTGAWTWDPTINANQPAKIYSATEGGELIGPDGKEYIDPGLGSYGRVEAANTEYRTPAFDDAKNYMSDALNFKLSPTEDGKLVGSNGRQYDDPSINENQDVYTHKPGEFVPGVHENEAAPNGYKTWGLMGNGAEPTSAPGGLPAGGADETGFVQAFGGAEGTGDSGGAQNGGFQSSGVDEAGFVQAFGGAEGTGESGGAQNGGFQSSGVDETGFVQAFGGAEGTGESGGGQNGGFQSSGADEAGFVQAFGGTEDGGGGGPSGGGDQTQSSSGGGADEAGFVDAFGGAE